jgi:hypothetical protein
VGIVLLIVSTLAALAMVVMFRVLAAREDRNQPALSPLAAALTPQEPPEPRLQTSPTKDIREMRAEEERLLHAYGWEDPNAGVVRLPIERAMELTAAEGLPAGSGGPHPAPAPGASRP